MIQESKSGEDPFAKCSRILHCSVPLGVSSSRCCHNVVCLNWIPKPRHRQGSVPKLDTQAKA